MTPRSYPDEVAGPYDPPPREFSDREGRTIRIRAFDAGPPASWSGSESESGSGSGSAAGSGADPDAAPAAGAGTERDAGAASRVFEALVSMYLDFDPADRAQGIPPIDEAAIRDWLDAITGEGSINVVGWHDAAAVGHATLVPDDSDAFELAIFVLADYQEAGIGTELIEALLGLGRERGVERVWLTVERWNEPAKQLYRKVGFETTGEDSFEVEMSARLQDGDDGDANGDGADDPAAGR